MHVCFFEIYKSVVQTVCGYRMDTEQCFLLKARLDIGINKPFILCNHGKEEEYQKKWMEEFLANQYI